MKKLWRKVGVGLFWVAWPLWFVYLQFGKRTRVIVEAEGHVLVMKGWLSAGDWLLPGGGLHKGEEPALGAVRELREETGLELKPEKLKKLSSSEGKDFGLRFQFICFSTSLPTRFPVTTQKFEVSDAAWVPVEKLGDYPLSRLTRQLLDTWLKR